MFLAAALWAGFAAVLLGMYRPSWLPAPFLKLTPPSSAADFGQAFSALEGLTSSFALMIGLIAIVIQARHSTDSNLISALTTRQQFLLADCERLEQSIQDLKSNRRTNEALFDNLVQKKKRQLDEAKLIDDRVRKLLENI